MPWLSEEQEFTNSEMNISFSRLVHAISKSWLDYRINELNRLAVGKQAQYSKIFHQILLEGKTPKLTKEMSCNHRSKEGRDNFQFWVDCLEPGTVVEANYHSVENLIEKIRRRDITVISNTDLCRAQKMANSVKSRPFWQTISPESEFELKGEFVHDGVHIRIKPDIKCKPRRLLADLKVTFDVTPYGVAKRVFEGFMDVQGAMYVKGSSEIDDVDYSKYVIIAVQDTEPYHCQEYIIPAQLIQGAWDLVNKKIQEYKQCKMMDSWPGHSETPMELRWPDWMMYRREEMINEQ